MWLNNVQSILNNVQCECEKNVISTVAAWRVLHKSVRPRWF